MTQNIFEFQKISSETVLKGRAFEIHKDRYVLPDHRQVDYDIVVHTGAVTLIPIDDQNRILFVHQYRPPAETVLLELPAGTLHAGENPDVCAARELQEETGMAAGNLRKVAEFWLAPGYSTECMRVYLATHLYASPLPHDDDEFLSIEAIPLPQAIRMAQDGTIKDAKTLLGVLLAASILSQ